MKILFIVTLMSFASSAFSQERIIFDSHSRSEEGLPAFVNPRVQLYDGDKPEFPIASMEAGQACVGLGYQKGVMRAETKEVWTRVVVNLHALINKDQLILENNLKGVGNERNHGRAISYLVCQE